MFCETRPETEANVDVKKRDEIETTAAVLVKIIHLVGPLPRLWSEYDIARRAGLSSCPLRPGYQSPYYRSTTAVVGYILYYCGLLCFFFT